MEKILLKKICYFLRLFLINLKKSIFHPYQKTCIGSDILKSTVEVLFREFLLFNENSSYIFDYFFFILIYSFIIQLKSIFFVFLYLNCSKQYYKLKLQSSLLFCINISILLNFLKIFIFTLVNSSIKDEKGVFC